MTPKKVTTDQAVKMVTDLQACQGEVESAKAARDNAEKALAKAQEAFRVAANRYEAAVIARDQTLTATVGGG